MCYSMYTLGVGCVIASIVTLPPWKCFRSTDNIKWLQPYPEVDSAASPPAAGGKKTAQKSKK